LSQIQIRPWIFHSTTPAMMDCHRNAFSIRDHLSNVTLSILRLVALQKPPQCLPRGEVADDRLDDDAHRARQ
jgi:hypothetical protein